ncbi:GDP-mannose 4,6-dehydratase [Candidatus Lokiarchaeum ossiferum]|uniref:GDP-mannose 4,6-dehydratase n=1 Tax=Candidatus Lokiarchaeum ossiferum TaxID=2951803 RepID=A0ABY6HWY5_9ARCH|nr:GDP-mannose 4,6-dehydratase [Candidatus Lokiarchaeum sp. B-35]
MKILITGGLGFIGSNFIHYILDENPEVNIVNLDGMTYAGNPENLKSIESNPRYKFVKGNICNYELVDYVLKTHHITHIVHFAAESHVDRSISNPDIFIETNIRGTLTLLNAAKANNIQKFVQVSTDEVYGSLSFDDPAFTEENQLCPRSPYSSSKTAADLLVLSYVHTYKLPAVITRCSNNYGAYQFPEKLIPLMIRNIQMEKKLPVYGDGTNIRDWIHVMDHCRGIYATLMKGKVGEVYNFGGNAEVSNINMVKFLLKELGKGEDLITFVKDRPGHDVRYAMNFSKAEKELGWTPKYKFEDGMRETIQWYLSNQDWVDNVTSGDYLDYYKKQYNSEK